MTDVARTASGPTKGPGAVRRRRLRRLEVWLFLLPALTLYLVFVIYPIFQAAHYSLFEWNGLDPLTDYVGLQNYRDAFADDRFRGAIQHNFTLVVLSLVVQLPIALGLALLLNRRLPGRGALRLIFFAPYVLSEVITGVIWLLILQPDGLADHFLRAVGLGDLVHLWLAD